MTVFMILELIKLVGIVAGLTCWLGCVATNANLAYQWIKHKKSGSSIPFIGGLIGSVTFLLSPWPMLHPFFLLPLLSDASYGLAIYSLVVNFLKK